MADDKVKVVGYAQRTFYDDGIEYRNFTDDLVGFQLTSNGGTPLFTMSNFNITTNIDPKPSKIFTTNKFSNFFSLEDLSVTASEIQAIVGDRNKVKLNLDNSNLCYHAYFGSLREYMRVSLEEIIINWPASLYVQEYTDGFNTADTFSNYSYTMATDIATLEVSTDVLTNKFEINYQTNGTIADSFSETNDLRNLTVNYTDYVIFYNNVEYPIIDFTGSTSVSADTIYLTIKGHPFSGASSNANYHIKPKATKVEEFFNGLPGLQSYMLNRLTSPQYTADYNFAVIGDDGQVTYTNRELTWPVSDGYNIDFDTTEYVKFVGDLLAIADASDGSKTDLMTRFLTSESISDFDTLPKCDGEEEETAGQKMNKTLKIYGREYDEIKKYIDGIKFANTVSYDKKDNTPDATLKYLARVLGWDLVSSVLENDLLKAYLTPSDTGFSGHTRGLTPAEAEVELWRRIILNTPWIWKSKGTRKGVEFFFKFIGAPDGLISFNEYIYTAKEALDIDLFLDVLEQNNLDRDVDPYNVDSEGFPKVLADTPDMYFQKGGLWWRETGGPNSQIDILQGNNPHVGPYDGGQEYINQFNCLIPNFSAVTITKEIITTGTTNIFTNYNSGVVNDTVDRNTYVDIVDADNFPIDCLEIEASIIDDPQPTSEFTECGCDSPVDDESIRVYIKSSPNLSSAESLKPADCGYVRFELNQDGMVDFYDSNDRIISNIGSDCCEGLGFQYGQVAFDKAGVVTNVESDIQSYKYCRWGEVKTDPCANLKAVSTETRRTNEGKFIRTDIFIVWDNNGVQSTEIQSPECCTSYKEGFTAVDIGNGRYECLVRSDRRSNAA